MGTPAAASLSSHELFSHLMQRPGLIALELLWRWLCGGLLSALAAYQGLRIWVAVLPAVHGTGVTTLSLGSILEDPSQLSATLAAVFSILWPPFVHALVGLVPLGLFCWIASFAVARTAILKRFDRSLPRDPWLLAGCETVSLAGGVSITLLAQASFHLASALLLGGESPSFVLFSLVALGITVAAMSGWSWWARKSAFAMALGLMGNLSTRQAILRAWQLPDARLAERARRFRRSSRKAALLLVSPAFILSCVPSPFHGPWVMLAWYGILSLLPLAATDMVRLGVFFALVTGIREEHALRGGDPGAFIRL